MALPLTIYLLVVGLADNILKPMLMGRGLNTPMLVIFIGVLGGMIAHGIVGLFVGPIILAVAWQLMMAWIREERTEAASLDVEHRQRSRRVSDDAFASCYVTAGSSYDDVPNPVSGPFDLYQRTAPLPPPF